MRHNRRPATMWQRSCGQGAPGPTGHCRCTECSARGHPAAGDSEHARTDRGDAVPRHPWRVLARDRAGSSVCPICAFLFVNIYLLMVCLRNVSREWCHRRPLIFFDTDPLKAEETKRGELIVNETEASLVMQVHAEEQSRDRTLMRGNSQITCVARASLAVVVNGGVGARGRARGGHRRHLAISVATGVAGRSAVAVARRRGAFFRWLDLPVHRGLADYGLRDARSWSARRCSRSTNFRVGKRRASLCRLCAATLRATYAIALLTITGHVESANRVTR